MLRLNDEIGLYVFQTLIYRNAFIENRELHKVGRKHNKTNRKLRNYQKKY